MVTAISSAYPGIFRIKCEAIKKKKNNIQPNIDNNNKIKRK